MWTTGRGARPIALWFIGNLQPTAELPRLDRDGFVAYKDLLIDYLERFVGELVLACG